MVNSEECVRQFLREFPNFKPYWEEHVDFWEGKDAGICNDCSVFSNYLSDILAAGNTEDARRAFILIEQLLEVGDGPVQDGVATCILENLLNYWSAGDITSESFVDLLGPRSRRHCKAWDQFTGVYTPGLW